MSTLILIAEDEPAQAEVLRYNLEHEGYRTMVAIDGREAIAMIEDDHPDLAILDWMMPEMSGIEVCRHIRSTPDIKHLPVILLTARGEEQDKVKGLETGADDYVVKPFSPAEMVARVKALLRRSNPSLSEETLDYAGVSIDLAKHKVTRDGRAVKLGPTEYRLLKTLMEKPGRVYSRERLLDLVWGRDVYVEDRTVDVHVRRLRKALNEGDLSDMIRTVRGAGYAIDAEDAS